MKGRVFLQGKGLELISGHTFRLKQSKTLVKPSKTVLCELMQLQKMSRSKSVLGMTLSYHHANIFAQYLQNWLSYGCFCIG